MGSDLDKYHKTTTRRLILGGLLIIYVVGGILIYIFYGSGAAGLGILCLTVGLLPIIAIVIIFWVLDWIVKKANRDE
jgi:hypothetical protein